MKAINKINTAFIIITIIYSTKFNQCPKRPCLDMTDV